MEGYSKEVLQDLTVNGWRPALTALVIFVVLMILIATQVANLSFIWALVVLGLYLVATMWAAAGYSLFKRPDGGLPKSNGSLALSIVVLLVPRELLR